MRKRPDSGIDVGIYYRDRHTFSIEGLEKMAHQLNDHSNTVITDFRKPGGEGVKPLLPVVAVLIDPHGGIMQWSSVEAAAAEAIAALLA